MCRHIAYLGEPVSIRSVLADPPHGLVAQAWAPRRQRSGVVNADGFGVGWYADGDPVPARYRRAGPIWSDQSFADLARVTTTRALLAAVRSATAGTEQGESAAAPYAAGRWLFSHNGALSGWPSAAWPDCGAAAEASGAAGPVTALAQALTPAELLGLTARFESALIWALVLARLRAGAGPADALAGTIGALRDAGAAGRFNLLLTDGSAITATAAGDSLCFRRGQAGVVVASEPFDDEPGWQEVPDGSLVEATPAQVTVRPLDGGSWWRAQAGGQRQADSPGPVRIDRRLPADFFETSLRADAAAGLTCMPKTLPPKWFYDERGSELFDKITLLDEYYPTRAEREILASRAAEIAAACGASALVELGSGTAEKTPLLLDALAAHGTLTQYVPVDVSESALATAAQRMLTRYPGLSVRAVLSDFTHFRGLRGLLDQPGTPGEREGQSGPRLVAFLGGTIGNLLPAERAAFLGALGAGLRPGDALLLGTDLVKDPEVLVRAYDDAAGVTAEFNKNILRVLNAELGADFDVDEFDHVALWDPRAEWIEMRLRSATEQEVHVRALGLTVRFAAGEEMRTEVSAKFRRQTVAAELAAAGLSMRSWWTDRRGQFGMSLSAPA